MADAIGCYPGKLEMRRSQQHATKIAQPIIERLDERHGLVFTAAE
jgi:hypothetical protein